MMRAILKISLALSLLFTAFLCGFNISEWQSTRGKGQQAAFASNPLELLGRLFASRNADADGDNFTPPRAYRAAVTAIRHDYLGTTPNPTRLTYAAIDGMLDTIGDPYTVFWTPGEYRENMETNSGDFVGIGARLDTAKDGRLIVLAPLDDSPASAAGIQAGDVVTAIDNHPTVGMTLDAAIELIKGPEGSPIQLTTLRGTQPHVYSLKRAIVHAPIVDYRMVDPVNKIGYIELGMFNEQADVQFDAALLKLEKQGMKALVFDLRDNPGGLLQMAQDLASRFIANGAIVWVKEKSGRLSSLNVENDKHRSPLYKGAYPVIVLVNSDSASASEIVAGALQDSKAAQLVGTRTYGKGLVQTIMPLADDSAVKITTQHYFTRDQHDINVPRDQEGRALGTNGGIKPDFEVPFTDKEAAIQRAAVVSDPRNKTIADKYDPQLQKALQVLDDKLRAK